MTNTILPELLVMQTIAKSIEHLTPAEKRRVAAWLFEYAADERAEAAATDAEPTATIESEMAQDTPEAFGIDAYATFGDLYEQVQPKTGAQKAVTAGYWLERKNSQDIWKASEVNKLLKSIDVNVSSISIVLTNAVKAKLPMIDELERLGDGNRSRKTFRLNDAGVSFVEDHLPQA